MTLNDNSEILHYTRQLGDADVNIRNKAVKKLKNFLKFYTSNKGFLYEDLIKIWKGLYYCMYMSDKPLFQEDLAEDISNLIHGISTNSQKLLFFKASLDTLVREWNGIDKYRYDKFLMLITRILRQMFIFLSKISWNKNVLRETCEILESHIVCPSDNKNEKPLELKMYFSDIILEELAKVGKETLPDRVLISVIQPFLKVLAISKNNTYVLNVTNRVLHALIKQSKLGIENEEDITSKEISVTPKVAKKKLRDNEEHFDEIDEKDEDMIMDPRIGGVDVYLPVLRPNYNKVAAAIESIAHDPDVLRQRRKTLFLHARKFRLLSEGVYPFNFPDVIQHLKEKENSKKALKRLVEFDEKISLKRIKLIDDLDIEEIENYQPEKSPEDTENVKIKTKKEVSKKKEANIKRSLQIKKKKRQRTRKMNKYKDNPEALQNFLQKERKERMNKQKPNGGKNKVNNLKKVPIDKGVNLKKDHIAETPKLKADVKTCVKQDRNSSSIVKTKNDKTKKNVPILKDSTDQKLIASSAGRVKILKSKKANKQPSKNTFNVQSNSKGNNIDALKSLEKKLDKKDPWKEPLKEGEVEIEVTKKKYSKKVKSGLVMRKTPNINTKGRVLKINLKNNTEHEFGDYKMAVKQSPGIPFSSQRRPLPSVLKSSDTSNLMKKKKKVKSRINFIRRKSKL